MFLSFNFCFSQNLIKNGGFEINNSLPNNISQIILATNWKPISVTAKERATQV